MSEPILELTNPAHWDLSFQRSFAARRLGANQFASIPEFSIPILMESPILMVRTASSDARAWWWLAATLRMALDSPGVSADELFAQRRKIPVNRTSLIRFPRLAAQYRLNLAIVPWIEGLTFNLWQYTGPIGDTTERTIVEQAEVIRVDLARIEARLNQP